MPLYAYECRKCGGDYEALASVKTADQSDCPACGSLDTQRQLGLPARVSSQPAATNCAGDGPPCGAPRCGRRSS